MSAWFEGRRIDELAVAREQAPLREFLAALEKNPPQQVPGTAVYMVSDAERRATRAIAEHSFQSEVTPAHHPAPASCIPQCRACRRRNA